MPPGLLISAIFLAAMVLAEAESSTTNALQEHERHEKHEKNKAARPRTSLFVCFVSFVFVVLGGPGLVIDFVSAALGTGFAAQFFPMIGRRFSNTMAKWFRAAFQPRIGIVHRFDASWIARYTSFKADSAFGYCLRLRVNFRITLLTDSMGVRRVDRLADRRRKVKQRDHVVPLQAPLLDNCRILLAPDFSEFLQLLLRFCHR